jgi:cell surface protein SprA
LHSQLRYKKLLACLWLVILLPAHILCAQETSDTTKTKLLKLPKDPLVPWDATKNSPLYLNDPSNITISSVFDALNNQYIIYQKIGTLDYRNPVYLTPQEYRKYSFDRAMREYWDASLRGDVQGFKSSLIPQLEVGGETFDKVFGSNVINIVPQGSAELIFGLNISHTENPSLSERLRTVPTFDFKEKIQMNVTGSIGDKVQLGINYNTDAMFDFENRTKLEYSGKEDEIIKKIEAGDVTLPLNGTLIQGSYSLFGLKTELQFGKMTMTSIFSQQKGESTTIQLKGGGQLTDFEIAADEYEANKHFFLSQYFRDTYDQSLRNLPAISSGIQIQKIEVWITNKTGVFVEGSNRNIAAFMDLAEGKGNIYNSIPNFQATGGTGALPQNSTNGMYEQMTSTYDGIRDVNNVTEVLSALPSSFQIGQDYEKVENARKLSSTEYSVNEQLGYISLNSALNNDEVLAVAYEYTYNGELYKVGEFSTDGIASPKTLIVKMLKGTSFSPKYPTWKLMMKNIYSLGSGSVESDGFKLNVLYEDDATGNSVNYIPNTPLKNKILLQVLRLDNLNSQNDVQPDGVFDFVEGVTVNATKGRIIFPVLEPFGSYLENYITDPIQRSKYVYTELYDSTKTVAKQIAEKDKFLIKGECTSAMTSEISLNYTNLPQGSVKVAANGVTLTENVDYTVDYNLGTVKIINSAILEAQSPITISFESNQNFGLQTKSLFGTHINYAVSDKLNIGGTFLHLSEKPYTTKVSYGEDPISNSVYGLDLSYKTDSRFLTTMIDKIPFIQTSTPSSINFFGEFAYLDPGHSKAVSSAGIVYIDDFESSEIPLDLRTYSAWALASVPQGQSSLFPEGSLTKNLKSGINRAKLAWYVIDPLFLQNGSTTPSNIRSDANTQSSHFVRQIYETEIFPNKQSSTGIPATISVLNVAFYPDERGPYNFDTSPSSYSAGLTAKGLLSSPQTRWGGMMRSLLTNDFESANIQYLKFWLMDPFVEDMNETGGDLYFDLGDVSEDILRDSRKQFENGLPTSSSVIDVDTTIWGRVPTVQSVVHAFASDASSRKYQDVGLDGLSDADELTFFDNYLQSVGAVVSPETLAAIEKDPSGDDFHYYRGSDYDEEKLGILDRYKNFNGTEGNSGTAEMSSESYSTTGTSLPDGEDINLDNTMNETETYFQYKVSLRPEDMVVGDNYIVDTISYRATFANGKKSRVRWYEFDIPLSDYQKAIGTISDFKSIRFIRMFMRNFDQNVVLRFARLELVRAEWRKYNLTFFEGGERITIPEESDGTFELSSVGIEENATKTPVNYVLPPGFNREIDPSNTQLTELDEKSMVLKVNDLTDGDARAAYKTLNLDMRRYKRLRMEIHAEAVSGQSLSDDDLTVFIRIGSDYKSNFYEYEIPLKLTPPGSYSDDSDTDRAIVWPSDNSMNIVLKDLVNIKEARDKALYAANSSLSVSDLYSVASGSARISVCGNPNLSNVKVVMIGIRNPIKTRNPTVDDGSSKTAEVWVNELRLTDFNEDGGWAANAQIQAKLADLGTVNATGQMSTAGWGSIDSKVNERSTDDVMKYDVSGNFELGKFFPEKTGVRLPVYVAYSKSTVTPYYDPYDPDVTLRETLSNAATSAEKDSILNNSRDYSRRKTLTISNAGITKRGDKAKPWDVANLSVNVSRTEEYSSDPETEIDLQRTFRGGLTYDYEANPKNFTPFKSVKLLNAPAFKLLKDFNFYLFPKHLTYRSEIYRYYNETKLRNLTDADLIIEPTFTKELEWTNYYDVKYDITKQLKFDFTANSIARIDEPDGPADKRRYPDSYSAWRDSVLTNFMHLGRTTSYYHFYNLNYNIPINKLPLMSWMSSNLRYSGRYDWLAGTVYPDSMNINLGNTIKNASNGQLTLQANMTNLYGKSKFLKRIENETQPGAGKKLNAGTDEVKYVREALSFKAGKPKFITHNLKTKDVTAVVKKADGSEVKGNIRIISPTRVEFTSDTDVDNATVTVTGKVPKKQDLLKILGRYTVRGLMALRNVSGTYTLEQGQLMPGYLPGTSFLGSEYYNGKMAPGWRYLTGLSDENFFNEALSYGWITRDTLQTTAASYTKREQINLRASIEPFPGLKIDLTADRRFSRTVSAYYTADRYGHFPDSTRNTAVSGTFSISVISWGTAFEKISSKNDYESPAFKRFRQYTTIISKRRAAERKAVDGSYDPNFDPVNATVVSGDYASGYSMSSVEVLVPAFVAAYTRRDPNKISLNPFPGILQMMPNWRITFEGLTKYDAIKSIFNSVSLSHQYKSTYTIGSFATDMDYSPDEDGISRIRDLESNFVPKYEINTVTINEQFSPLINIDLGWKNSLTTRIEYRKSRTVTLNMTSDQIADVRNNEITVGMGYRFDDVHIIINSGGTQKSLKSDLNLRLDFSLRDNKTLARKLAEDVNQPVAGQKVMTIGATADYQLSDRFSIQLYGDHTINSPFVSTTYPTWDTNFGFSLKFTLAK